MKQSGDEMRQVGDGSVLTVAVMALESASPGVLAGRLEISCSGRVLVGVFADPRADDAVRTCHAIQRLEIQIGFLEHMQETIGIAVRTAMWSGAAGSDAFRSAGGR